MSPGPRAAVSRLERGARRRAGALLRGSAPGSLQARRAAHKTLTAVHIARGLRLIEASGYFDVSWYSAQTGLRFGTARAAILHYLRVGRTQDLSPHPLYEPRSHMRDEKKRLKGRVAPFVLFLHQCRLPRIRPHYVFDAAAYLEQHPDAAGHPFGAWGHFVERATPDTRLPVPDWLPPGTVTYGDFVEGQRRHAVRWSRQDALVAPPRLVDAHDEAAQRRLEAELATHPAPPPARPMVSVLTTVRNRPNQVLEAIASVLAQTMDDWEMIVVDDGSDDTTPDAVEAVAQRDPRVTLLRRQHAGVSAARNAAIAVARGRYVAWLDSDNTWQPRFLAVMVAAMHGRGARAAYCACEFVSGETTLFREFAGGLEHLAIGNFVDLNVLLVERELLTEIGGFDPSLPRAVDYDLVARIAARTELSYVPFLGVIYTDDADDPHRISVKEYKSWNYVVRDRLVVGWDRVAAGVPRRVPGRLSVVVAGRERWDDMWRTVYSVLEHTDPGTDLEVVVVDLGSRRASYLLAAVTEAFDPRARVLRTPLNVNVATGYNLGLANTTGDTVAVLAPGVVVQPGWLPPLRAALAEPGVVAAGGVTISRDGPLASAGLVLPSATTLPVHLLRDHPVTDSAGLAEPFEAPALAHGVTLVRAADLVAVRGFDALYVDAFEDADLCLRLRDRFDGRCLVVPESRAVVPPGLLFEFGDTEPDNMRLFRSRWSRHADDRPDLWLRAGFALDGYRADQVLRPRRGRDDVPTEVPVTRPLLRRCDPVGVRRWAVEEPDADPDDPGTVVAGAVVALLAERGERVVTRRASLRHRSPAYLDDVVVVVDGPYGPGAGPADGAPTVRVEVARPPQADDSGNAAGAATTATGQVGNGTAVQDLPTGFTAVITVPEAASAREAAAQVVAQLDALVAARGSSSPATQDPDGHDGLTHDGLTLSAEGNGAHGAEGNGAEGNGAHGAEGNGANGHGGAAEPVTTAAPAAARQHTD